MFCGRCCVTALRSRPALRLDIFIEILLRTRVNNLFGECARLSSLASSLLAGKGYGKDVL